MKSRNLLLALLLTATLYTSSCASAALGESAFPDVDPSTDVDYIGEAVTMTRAQLDQQRAQEGTGQAGTDTASGSI